MKKKPHRVTLRLDQKSREVLLEAARLRRISLSEFVRCASVSQAKKEIEGAKNNILVLTADEQLDFWNELNRPPRLTEARQRLGRLIRGEEE